MTMFHDVRKFAPEKVEANAVTYGGYEIVLHEEVAGFTYSIYEIENKRKRKREVNFTENLFLTKKEAVRDAKGWIKEHIRLVDSLFFKSFGIQ